MPLQPVREESWWKSVPDCCPSGGQSWSIFLRRGSIQAHRSQHPDVGISSLPVSLSLCPHPDSWGHLPNKAPASKDFSKSALRLPQTATLPHDTPTNIASLRNLTIMLAAVVSTPSADQNFPSSLSPRLAQGQARSRSLLNQTDPQSFCWGFWRVDSVDAAQPVGVVASRWLHIVLLFLPLIGRLCFPSS